MKETKEKLQQEIERLTARIVGISDKEQQMEKLINLLVTDSPLSFERKFNLCVELYKGLEIEKKEKAYNFKYDIRNGWGSFQNETIEGGLNKLLLIK